jgi:hypothetical protein
MVEVGWRLVTVIGERVLVTVQSSGFEGCPRLIGSQEAWLTVGRRRMSGVNNMINE